MKSQIIKIILLAFLVLVGCNKENTQVEKTINAGFKKITIENPNGGNMLVAIWYPTYENENAYIYNTVSTNLNITGKVAYDSEIAESGWPLIVFSHGFSGSGIGSVEICEALAKSGYVIAVPDHSDAVMSARIEGSATGTIDDALTYLESNPFDDGSNYEYRISEIQAVITNLKTNTNFKIDPDKLILGGHSMGGWTVFKSLQNNNNTKAIFLFSMGELNWLFKEQRYFDSDFFQSLTFPTAYFYGGVEYNQAISAGRDNVYAAYCFTHSPSPSYGLLVPQGNHFTYNSKAISPQLYGDENQSASITTKLINYLDKHVKGKNINVSNDPLDLTK